MQERELLERICVPRRLGSHDHDKVGRYISNRMSSLGYKVEKEGFGIRAGFTQATRALALVLSIALITSLLALSPLPLLSLVILLLTPILIISVISSRSIYSRLALTPEKEGLKGTNIVASKGKGRPLVLSAHYDSKSQSMGLWSRITMFVLLALFYLSGISVILLFLLIPGWPSPSNIFLAYIFLTTALVLALGAALGKDGNKSPGAYDNGISVVSLMLLAKRFSAQDTEGRRLIFLFTDGEEMGILGALHYSRTHDLSRADIINLDIPFDAKGRIYVNKGVIIPPFRTSQQLNDIIGAAGSRLGLKIRESLVPVGAMADHLILGKNAARCTSFLGHTPFVHTPGDRSERVDTEHFTSFTELLEPVVKEILRS